MKLVVENKKMTYWYRPKIVYYYDLEEKESSPANKWWGDCYYKSKEEFYDAFQSPYKRKTEEVKVFEWEVRLMPESYHDFWFEEDEKEYSKLPPNCS